MNKYTRKLVARHPLQTGETVLAELEGQGLDSNGTPVHAAALAVTERRIGIWHDRPHAGFLPLSRVQRIQFSDEALHIQWDGDTEYPFQASSAEALEGFVNVFFEQRTKSVFDGVRTQLQLALANLRAGDVESALAPLEAVMQAEYYHPGPAMLRYIVLRAMGRPNEAADSLIDAAPRGQLALPWATTTLLCDARFDQVQEYRLACLLGIREPLSQQSPWQLLVSTEDALRRAKYDQAFSAASQFVRMFGSATLGFAVLYTVSKRLPAAYGNQFVAVMNDLLAQHDKQSQTDERAADLVQLRAAWAAMQAPDASPWARAEAELSCARATAVPPDDLGTDHADALRTLCAWDQLDVVPPAAPPSSTWRGACEDAAMFDELVQFCDKTFAKVEKAEVQWARLRSGKLTATPEVARDARHHHETLLGGHSSSVPAVWISALGAAELLLRTGDRNAAIELLERAYRVIRADVPYFASPYFTDAQALRDFYVALGKRDGARIRLLLALFESKPSFQWARDVVVQLAPNAMRPSLPQNVEVSALVASFVTWVEARRSKLESDAAAVRAAVLSIQRAQRREWLTVVVGGETSAGKSSFINRLVGAEILHATQEEATAIPTHLRWGPEWKLSVLSANERVRDTLKISPGDPQMQSKAKEFVRRYTFLASKDSAGTQRMLVEAPIPMLQREMEIVDTPGMNAYQERTRLAEDSIDDAHVCIFVIDARNALKSGEMRKIRWAAAAVGKTMFVLNKMDAVLGDDDLDCDANAPDDVLHRVRSELSAALRTSTVHVHAVSSIPEAAASPAALPYVHSIAGVRRDLEGMLRGSRERLVAYSAAKAARIAARAALEHALARVDHLEVERGQLLSQVPRDESAFRAEVLPVVNDVWYGARNAFEGAMVSAMQHAGQRADEAVIEGLQACSDRDDIKSFVERKVGKILRDYVSAVDLARTRQWDVAARTVLDHVSGLFRFLYDGLPFETRFDSSRLLSVATPMPLAKQGDLQSVVGSLVDGAQFMQMGGAAAGALLGSLLLPGIGTVLGGVFGGMFGSSLSEDMMTKIYEAISGKVGEVQQETGNVLQRDITPVADAPAPMLAAILQNVNAERARFKQMIDQSLTSKTTQLAEADRQAEMYRTVASEALDWACRFEGSLVTERAALGEAR